MKFKTKTVTTTYFEELKFADNMSYVRKLRKKFPDVDIQAVKGPWADDGTEMRSMRCTSQVPLGSTADIPTELLEEIETEIAKSSRVYLYQISAIGPIVDVTSYEPHMSYLFRGKFCV